MSETTKQIYAAIDDGWALDQLCAHFNQTPEQIKQFLSNRRYTHQQPSVSFCRQCGRQTNLKKQFCDACSSTRKRNAYLISEYGITLDDAQRMYREQNSCCAVCHCVYDFDQLVVDHDHETGFVPGLLCPTCNSGIGLLKEDITIVESAVRYLKR